MPKESHVVLCHKCRGNLSGPSEGLFGCGCMSGWIRDWQVAIPVEEAIIEQKKELLMREKERLEREKKQ